jgi:hypothetical protein
MCVQAAPKADCHTQQYFHYMGHKGEVRADQCKRGYNWSVYESSVAANKLFIISNMLMPINSFTHLRGLLVPHDRGMFGLDNSRRWARGLLVPHDRGMFGLDNSRRWARGLLVPHDRGMFGLDNSRRWARGMACGLLLVFAAYYLSITLHYFQTHLPNQFIATSDL